MALCCAPHRALFVDRSSRRLPGSFTFELLCGYSRGMTKRGIAIRFAEDDKVEVAGRKQVLDLLQSLHVMHPRNLPHAVDDFLEVFQVGDFEDYVHAHFPVLAASLYVAD